VYDSEGNWSESLIFAIGGDPLDVEITKPEVGLCIKNIKIRKRLFLRPLILGDVDITVDTFDDSSGINQVEFYIDGELNGIDNSSPYIYT